MYKAISSIGKVSVRQLVCWVGADAKGVHWNVMEDDGAQPENAEETARLIADLLNKHAAQEVPAPADPVMPSPEVRAALALLIDAGSLLGAQDGEHFRTAARTVHAWLYGPVEHTRGGGVT